MFRINQNRQVPFPMFEWTNDLTPSNVYFAFRGHVTKHDRDCITFAAGTLIGFRQRDQTGRLGNELQCTESKGPVTVATQPDSEPIFAGNDIQVDSLNPCGVLVTEYLEYFQKRSQMALEYQEFLNRKLDAVRSTKSENTNM